jgi:predicted hydrocarbon binding protein
MADARSRSLSNRQVRRFLLAIQEVMGLGGLTTVLRQGGLVRFAGALPPDNDHPGLAAAEYAALIQAIENYYGRGARGTLLRIGYASFNGLTASQPRRAALYRLLFRVLPLRSRQILTLRWLAHEMAGPGGRVTVHLDSQHTIFVDHESDATVGRSRDTEICWVTAGQIREALKWGTGREHDVTEVACKAKGDPACRFEIGEVAA